MNLNKNIWLDQEPGTPATMVKNSTTELHRPNGNIHSLYSPTSTFLPPLNGLQPRRHNTSSPYCQDFLILFM